MGIAKSGRLASINRLENNGLPVTCAEKQIEQVLVTATNWILCPKNDFLSILKQNIESAL